MRFKLDGGMIPRTVKRMFDQRAEARSDAQRQSAMLSFRSQPHIVELINLSPSGAMIHFTKTPRIGESVTLQMVDRKPIPGHVRWVRDEYVGIHFVTFGS